MTVLVTIGLAWLVGWFIFMMIVTGLRAARVMRSKDGAEKVAGYIVLVVSPICHMLAILTVIGALFAIHGNG